MSEQTNTNFPLLPFLAYSALLLAMLSGLFILRLDEVNVTLEKRIAERQALSQRTVENEFARQIGINRQLADLFSRAERVQQLTAQAKEQREQANTELATTISRLQVVLTPVWNSLKIASLDQLQVHLAPDAQSLIKLEPPQLAATPGETDQNWLMQALKEGNTLNTIISGSKGLSVSTVAPIRANAQANSPIVGLLELSSRQLPNLDQLAKSLNVDISVLQEQPNSFRRPISPWREISHTGKNALDLQQLNLYENVDQVLPLRIDNLREHLMISFIPLPGIAGQPRIVVAIREDLQPLLKEHQQAAFNVKLRWGFAWAVLQLILILIMYARGKGDSQRSILLKFQKTEAATSQRMLELISLSQAGFITATNHAEVFDQLLLSILEFTDSAFGFFGETLYKPDGMPYLKTFAISNISWDAASAQFYADNAPKGMEFHNLDTLFGQVLKTSKPLLSNAPAKHPQRGGTPPGHPPLNAFLGLPVFHGKQQIGMLGIANRPGGYNESLIGQLQPLLACLAQLIDAVRRERVLNQEQALQQKQQRAMAVLNEIAARPTLAIDAQLRRALQLAAEFFGLQYALIGKTNEDTYSLSYQFATHDKVPDDLHLPLAETYCQITLGQGNDVTAVAHMSQSAYADHPCFKRLKFESYIGIPLLVEGRRWGVLSLSGFTPRQPGFDSADVEFMRLIGRWAGAALEGEAQERKRLELLQRLQRITEQVPGIIYQLDIDENGKRSMPFVSDGLYTLCNLHPEDMLEDATAFFEACHPDDLPQIEADLQQSRQTLTPWFSEFRIQNMPQHALWLGGQASPVRLYDGRIRWTGLLLDISDLKKAQETLQVERQRLDRILESTAAGTWEWNVQSGNVRFNERWAEMIGYRVSELSPTMDTWQDKTHPEDLKRASALLEQHFRGEIPYYDCEFRLRHKDGHWVWIHTRGSLLSRSESGEPLMMYGTHTDISARVEQQQENRKIQAFLQTVLESSTGVCMIATDINGLITLFNPGAESLLGFTAEEMVGKQTPATLHLEREILRRSVELSAEAGHPVTGFDVFTYRARQGRSETRQWTYLQKNGGFRQVMLTVSPLIGSEGELSGFFGVATDISELTRTSLALKDSEKRYRGMLSNLPGAVYRCLDDRHWTTLHMSDEIERITGYPASDFIDNRVRSFASIVLPEDEHIPRKATAMLAEKKSFELNYRIVHANGDLVWISDRGRGEYDESGNMLWADGFLSDVSEQRLAQQMIIEREAYLRTLLDNVIDAIITIDERGLIQSFNQAAERIFGHQQNDVIGCNVSMLMPEPDTSRHDSYMSRFQRSGEARIIGVAGRELYGLRSNGEQFPMELSVSDIQYQGQRRFIGVIRDITERKRIDQMKNEFVSTVSHELRTPLTSITGALGLISGGALGVMPEAAAGMLQIAHKNSQRLGLLINDLLDMDKLVAGKMTFHFSVQPLRPLIEETLQSNQPYADEYGVSWDLQTAEDDISVRVDALRLQVLANLLSNAAKFSPSGSQVQVRTELREGFVRISIEDQGAGIPAEFHSRIFGKFTQHDSSDTRQKGGTGLGLAISKQLIERMHGRIGFDSPPGRGACFWVELPREVSP